MNHISLALLMALALGCTDLTVLDERDPRAALPTSATALRWLHADFTGQTELVANKLRLYSSVPPTVAACHEQWQLDSAACVDEDFDGLSDRWELIALHRLRPFVRMHPDEPLFRDYYGQVVASGRVMRTSDDHIRILLPLVFSNDYGRCTATRHRGDPERIALDLVLVHANTVEVVGAYTASHEGTSADGSILMGAAQLGELQYVTDEATQMPRWVVYSSIGKHAMYPSAAACGAKGIAVCMNDDCASRDDARNDLLPDVYNVGEPNSPEFQFEGNDQESMDREATPSLRRDQVWGGQEYCGDIPDDATGSYSDACAGPIRDKVVNDPFR